MEIDIKEVDAIECQGFQPQIKDILELSFRFVKEYLTDKDADREKKFQIANDMLKKVGLNFDSYESSGNLKKRFEIFKRDDFTCGYCGRNSIDDKVKLQVDHIKPRSLGGKNHPSNLITACFDCNIGKRDFLLNDRHEKKLRGRKICVNNEENTINASS